MYAEDRSAIIHSAIIRSVPQIVLGSASTLLSAHAAALAVRIRHLLAEGPVVVAASTVAAAWATAAGSRQVAQVASTAAAAWVEADSLAVVVAVTMDANL